LTRLALLGSRRSRIYCLLLTSHVIGSAEKHEPTLIFHNSSSAASTPRALRAPRRALRARILATNERMRQILRDQHGANVLAIHGQAPAWPPVITLLGPFGAGRAGAGDHLQINLVSAEDDLAQPGGGACSQRPFGRTARALAFLGGIE